MKKYFLIIITVGLFCVNTDQEILNQIPRFETRDEAMHWVHDNIVWTLREDLDNWQSPEETMRLKTGVCSDMSILLMYIFKEQFGDDPELIAIAVDGWSIKHAVTKSNGKLFDPVINGINYNYEYLYSVNYNIALLISNYSTALY